MSPLGVPTRVTIHHTGFPAGFTSCEPSAIKINLQSILMLHTAPPPEGRGWADIGYHFAVDPAGRIWALRSLAYQGAHVRNHNENNIGVVALGNFDLHDLPDLQFTALRQLLAELRLAFPITDVFGHKHLADNATNCPGAAIVARWPQLSSR